MINQLHVGQKISGTVEKLVFGGSGLIRYQGIVVFVPDVIPGEQVTVQITRVKARYAEASLISIEKPSPHRIAPICPYAGRCGGCQLQHIDPSLHPALKKEWLRTALHKEDIDFEMVPAQQTIGWRRKITIHARFLERKWAFGFIGKDNVSIVPISWCPLFFTADEKSFLHRLKAIVDAIPGSPSAAIDITLFRLPEGAFSLILCGTLLISRQSQKALIHNLSALHSVKAFSLRFLRMQYDKGPTEFLFDALQTSWHCSVNAFIQNHKTQSEILWNDIITLVDSSGPRQTILDLYSGIGITAISLARRGHAVTAVELSEDAVQAARMSAQEILGKEQKMSIICSSVEEYLPTLKKGADWWIVNPPRTGLSKKVASQIDAKAPKRIVYVSCSPPTLARDLAILRAAQWRVLWVKGYDMFPQTTHFETVAVIERS